MSAQKRDKRQYGLNFEGHKHKDTQQSLKIFKPHPQMDKNNQPKRTKTLMALHDIYNIRMYIYICCRRLAS